MQNGFLYTSYPSPIPEIPGLGAMRIRKATEPMEWEDHENAFELLYLKSGEKKITVEDEEYNLYGGDLLVIHPGKVHGNYRAVQNRSFLYYLLIRDPMSDSGFLRLNGRDRAYLAQGLRRLRTVHLSPETRDLYLHLFDCAQRGGHLAGERAAALCLLLLDSLCSMAEGEKQEIPQDIQRVVNYINRQESEIPRVGEAAAIAGLSEPHFKQKFRRYLGMPPAEYIARVHVELAEQRLAESDAGIAEIASALGFSSGQHFSRLFRRYRGVSPSEYRRKLQGIPVPKERKSGGPES